MKTREQWERDARERGIAAAAWIHAESADMVQDVMDAIVEECEEDRFAPGSPLSGEWSGESIPEVFGIEVGGEWPTDDILDEYEQVFYRSYWDTLASAASEILQDYYANK